MQEILLMNPSATENGKVQYVELPDWRSCADYGRVSYSIPKPRAEMSAPLPERISPSVCMWGRGFSRLLFCLLRDTTVFYASMVVLRVTLIFNLDKQ